MATVKTNAAPGSQVVTDLHYNKGQPVADHLEKLGYYLGGYGCTPHTSATPAAAGRGINGD